MDTAAASWLLSCPPNPLHTSQAELPTEIRNQVLSLHCLKILECPPISLVPAYLISCFLAPPWLPPAILVFSQLLEHKPSSHHRVFAHALPISWTRGSPEWCFSSFRSQLKYNLLQETLRGHFFKIVVNICNKNLLFYPFLTVQLSGTKYIHIGTVVPLLPSSSSRIFSSSQTEMLMKQ